MNGTGEKSIREAVDSSVSDDARQIVDGDSFRDIHEGIRTADEEFLRAKGIIPKTFQQLLAEEAARAKEAGNEQGGEGGVGEGGEDVLGQLSGQERVTPQQFKTISQFLHWQTY